MGEALTRDAAGDPEHEALRAAMCQPREAYLWTPADTITFRPALLDTVYGDGRALLGLTTINSRPAYYIIRIDSRWEIGSDGESPDDAVEIWDHLEEIQSSLEEQFGNGRPGEYECEGDRESADYEMTDEEWEYGDPWPAFDDRNGCSWWRMDWPKGVAETEPHPFSPHHRIRVARPASLPLQTCEDGK